MSHPLVVLFLLANLGIGLWAYVRNGTGSFEEYAVASRSLPTGVLVMTLLGTFWAAGHFGGAGWVATKGILRMVVVLPTVVVCLFIGTFVAPCLVYFEGMRTTGDVMGALYGGLARVCTGLVGAILTVAVVGGQLKAIGKMAQDLWGIDSSVALVCFGIIAVLYSVFGGMRAVSYTDVLQILLSTAMVAWVFHACMAQLGGVAGVSGALAPRYTNPLAHPDFSSFVPAVMWASSGLFLTLLSPPIVQRMLMSGKEQGRSMWYLGLCLFLLVTCMLHGITMSGLAMGVEVDTMDVKSVTSLFLATVLRLFRSTWALDFVFVGMLAVAFSTMDSYLHAMGISFVGDFVEPLRGAFGLPAIAVERKTVWAKVVILFLGGLALLVGYVSEASLESIQLWRYASLVCPVVLLPLVLGILGVKTNTGSWVSFVVAYGVGSIVLHGMTTFSFYVGFNVATCMGALAYFLYHVYVHGGIVTLDRSQQTVAEKLWVPSVGGCWRGVRGWCGAVGNVSGLARVEVRRGRPAQPLAFTVVMFGLYVLGSMALHGGAGEGLSGVVGGLHAVGVVLCCSLLLEGLWMWSLQPYFPLYWLVVVFVSLPLMATLTFFCVYEGVVSVLLFVGSFVLLSYLVSPRTFFWMGVWALVLAHVGWYVVMGGWPAAMGSRWYGLGYGALAVVIVCVLAFGGGVESHVDRRLYVNRVLSDAVAHEAGHYLTDIGGIPFFIDEVDKSLTPTQNEAGEKGFFLPEKMKPYVENAPDQIEHALLNVEKEFIRFRGLLDSGFADQPQEKMSVATLMHNLVPEVTHRYGSRLAVTVTCKQDFEAYVIPSFFGSVLANIAKNARLHGDASKLEITIDGKARKVYMRDNGRGIPAEVLPHVFKLRFTTRRGKSSGLGLALIELILATSGIQIHCHARHGDGQSFAEFVLTFPKA